MGKFEKIVAEYDQTVGKIETVYQKVDTAKKEVLTEAQYVAFYKDAQKAFDHWPSKAVSDEEIKKGFAV